MPLKKIAMPFVLLKKFSGLQRHCSNFFCALHATAVSLGSNAVKLQRAYRGLKLTTAAVRDTISDGQALSIHDKLVSQNGRYALGFFETGNQIVLASLKSSKPYCPVVCGMEKDLTRRRKCQGTLVTCHL